MAAPDVKDAKDAKLDGERRKALNDRLQFSLSFEQDPWKERLEQPQLKKEFDVIPVKNLEVLA